MYGIFDIPYLKGCYECHGPDMLTKKKYVENGKKKITTS